MSNIGNQYDINMLNTRLKEMRSLRKLTQQELADAIGVKRQAIINWEKKGKNTIPSIENLVELCETLDCSMDYLLGSVDTPEIEPISKASHYSGISAKIIRYGIEHPDFLDCLNFFMSPDNIADLFSSVTLETWKKFWINSTIKEINGELKEKILSFYDEYISITPFEAINADSYKKFLQRKLPREKITLKADKSDSKIYIKKCFSLITYQNFFSNKEFNYSTFINYLVEHTFEPCSHNVIIEIQKNKLANKFAELFTKYLVEE
ncbi:MAG: helix-turn-helix domain-containing protein [Enterocloster bolteae]|uniref:helix-turn-helix domain-containing protein n=1 Tax=Enterocloster bolteae TaxID=208479 RepID=UPI003993387E